MKCICKIHGEKEFEINLNGDAFCKECKLINPAQNPLPDLSMGTSVAYSMGIKVNPPPIPKKIVTK